LRKLATSWVLVFAMSVLCGCRTTYEGPVKRSLVTPTGKKGPVIGITEKPKDFLASSNYRYATALPKDKLDKVITAMETYYMAMLKALKPRLKDLPELTNVLIVEDELSFRRAVAPYTDAIVDDNSAFLPSSRQIVVLYREGDKKFFSRLFRAQARVFFTDFMPELPLWLHEGLVLFFEEVAVGGGNQGVLRITGYSTGKLEKVQSLIESTELPQIARVSAIEERDSLTENDRLTAWAFIYWSQHSGRNSRFAFKSYLAALKEEGYDKVDIEKYLTMSLEEFEKRWRKWLLKQHVYATGGEKGLKRGAGK